MSLEVIDLTVVWGNKVPRSKGEKLKGEKKASKYLKGYSLTCLLRLIARHEQEIPNWKMKTKPRMIIY